MGHLDPPLRTVPRNVAGSEGRVIPRANPIARQLAAVQRRPAPCVHLVIPYESAPRVYVEAHTYSDEVRLIAWLRRAPTMDRVVCALAGLLEDAA